MEVAAVALDGRGEPNRSEKGEKTETSEPEVLGGARTAAMTVRNRRLCYQAVNGCSSVPRSAAGCISVHEVPLDV